MGIERILDYICRDESLKEKIPKRVDATRYQVDRARILACRTKSTHHDDVVLEDFPVECAE